MFRIQNGKVSSLFRHPFNCKAKAVARYQPNVAFLIPKSLLNRSKTANNFLWSLAYGRYVPGELVIFLDEEGRFGVFDTV